MRLSPFSASRSRSSGDFVVVKTPADALLPTPEGISDQVASTLPIAGLTAAAALAAIGLRPGDTVLAAGVGVFAVQLAKLAGATVIGTAAESTSGFLRKLGAEPVAYGAGLAGRVRTLAPGGVTAATDLYGTETAEAALALGVPPERISTIAAGPSLPGGVRATGGSDAGPADLQRITDAIAAGQITVPIAATFPIGQTMIRQVIGQPETGRGGAMAVDSSPVVAGAPETRRRYRRLRAFNIAVGVLLAAEAAYMLAASNDLALPVTASFLRTDPVAVTGATLPQVLFSLRIGPAVAFFLALAAVDHLLVASPGVHGWYERGLSRRAGYARWIEYSISASVMIVLIGLFTGIRDLAAVAAVFAANTAMILFGLLMERQQRPGAADWSAFWFGSLIGVVPWALIAVYVAQPAQVPGFVYAITIVQFVLFFSFAVNMVLQYAQVGRWRDYVYGEVVYIILSFTAKSLLAWLIFANVLRT